MRNGSDDNVGSGGGGVVGDAEATPGGVPLRPLHHSRVSRLFSRRAASLSALSIREAERARQTVSTREKIDERQTDDHRDIFLPLT